MDDKNRGDDGRYTPEVTDDELLAAVRTHEPAATSEVAGEVDMTRQGVDRRLRNLRDGGRVNSKKIGASLVWFAPDPTPDATTDDGGETTPRDGERESPPDVTLPEGLPDGVDPTPARTAIQAALSHVRDHGPVERRQIVNAVMPAHPLGYATDDLPLGSGEETRGSWWRRVVKPGLKTNGVSYRNGVGWRTDQ
jgi:hypothetical protein